MTGLLLDEVSIISRAADIRIRELTDVVSDFARGKISAQEANARYIRNSRKWFDALPGVDSVNGKTDEQIVEEMERARKERLSGRLYQQDPTGKSR
jgi:hypothetical protein